MYVTDCTLFNKILWILEPFETLNPLLTCLCSVYSQREGPATCLSAVSSTCVTAVVGHASSRQLREAATRVTILENRHYVLYNITRKICIWFCAVIQSIIVHYVIY